MAYDEFIDNLRYASRMLPPPNAEGGRGEADDESYRSAIHRADLWLTPKVVAGFDPADFSDWSKDDREELAREVTAFRTIAEQVPSHKPATKTQCREARKRLKNVIELVRRPILEHWLEAQEEMMDEASEAAKAKGWYTELEHTTIDESREPSGHIRGASASHTKHR